MTKPSSSGPLPGLSPAVPAEVKSESFIAHNMIGVRLEDFYQGLPADLGVWANLFLKVQVEGIKAKRTFQAMRSDLQCFIAFFQDYHAGLEMKNWLPRTTGRFVEHLEQAGRKPKSVARLLVTLRSFAKWVLSVRPNLFPMGDPTRGAKPPTQEALRPQGLSDRQVKRVLDAAFHRIGQAYPDQRLVGGAGPGQAMKRPLRDYAILMLLLNGGLRRAEACALDTAQLQERHLRQVKCKGNMFRDVLLGDETLAAIRNYLVQERPLDSPVFDGSDALFLPVACRLHRNASGRLSERTINVIVKTIEAAANLGLAASDRFQLHPHMFRHTHAYQVLKMGRSLPYVQKRLGHQSMNYLSLYTQMPEDEEQKLLGEAEFK